MESLSQSLGSKINLYFTGKCDTNKMVSGILKTMYRKRKAAEDTLTEVFCMTVHIVYGLC